MGFIATGDKQQIIAEIKTELNNKMSVGDYVADGKIKSSVLPSYVDDMVEYATYADFPATAEAGKIYLDKSTNTQYRWSGSQYVNITSGVIKDDSAGENTTYSSSKINTLLGNKTSIDDENASSTKTFSSTKMNNTFQGKTIADINNYFTTNTIEGALDEVGEKLSGVETLLAGI